MPHWYNRTSRAIGRHPFSTAVVTILIILVPGIVIISAKTDCATTYARRNFDRGQVITAAQNDWIETLQNLILHPPSGGQKVALAEFKAAAVKYDAIRAANPVSDTKPAHC